MKKNSEPLYIFLGDCNVMFDEFLSVSGYHKNSKKYGNLNQLGRNRRRLLQEHYINRELSRVKRNAFNFMVLTHDQDRNLLILKLIFKYFEILNTNIIFIHLYNKIQKHYELDICLNDISDFRNTPFLKEDLLIQKNLIKFLIITRKYEILQTATEIKCCTYVLENFSNAEFYSFNINNIPKNILKIIPNLKLLYLNYIKKLENQLSNNNCKTPKNIISILKSMDATRMKLYENFELKVKNNDRN